jgi:hypothetical protein
VFARVHGALDAVSHFGNALQITNASTAKLLHDNIRVRVHHDLSFVFG